jgi:histidinol phosphatase-like PHP family hydrolase
VKSFNCMHIEDCRSHKETQTFLVMGAILRLTRDHGRKVCYKSDTHSTRTANNECYKSIFIAASELPTIGLEQHFAAVNGE